MDATGTPPRPVVGGDPFLPPPSQSGAGASADFPGATSMAQPRQPETAGLPVKATQVSVVRAYGAPPSPQQPSSSRRISQVVDPRTGLTAVGTRSHIPMESPQKLPANLMPGCPASHRRCNSWGSDGRVATRPGQARAGASLPKGDRHSRSPSPAPSQMRASRSPSPARPLSEDEQLYMQGVAGPRRTASPATLSPRVKYRGPRSRSLAIQQPSVAHRAQPVAPLSATDSPTRRLQREIGEVNDELEKIYQVADNITNLANQDSTDGRKPGEYMLIGSPATKASMKTFPSPKQNRFFRQPPAEARTVSSTRPITAALPQQPSVTSSWIRQSSSAFSTMQL